jgi:Protein of unknown function with PCYCGC motif
MKKLAILSVKVSILACALVACNRESVVRGPEPAAARPAVPAATPAPPSPTAPVASVATPNRVAKPPSGHSKAELAASVADPGAVSSEIRQVYEHAKLVADRLDQMYCYCHCHENMGHRSLLTCFQGDHAAECGVCLREGYQAYQDWMNNIPVEQTQLTADKIYNGGMPPPHLPGKDGK